MDFYMPCLGIPQNDPPAYWLNCILTIFITEVMVMCLPWTGRKCQRVSFTMRCHHGDGGDFLIMFGLKMMMEVGNRDGWYFFWFWVWVWKKYLRSPYVWFFVFFRLSAFCWVVEDFISNLQYMLYRLQFALDMAGYLFVPFHSKSIVHVKNRVPSIAAINLLLQSTTTVILYTCHHSQ